MSKNTKTNKTKKNANNKSAKIKVNKNTKTIKANRNTYDYERKEGTVKIETLLSNFQKEITVRFLEFLIMIKLYHWKTTSYSTHKATDEAYSKLNANIDSFIEILLGKSGSRTNLTQDKTIKLIDLDTFDKLKREINDFKSYLIQLNNHPAMKLMSNTDLYNIRDTILGDMNQLLYLLSFT